MSLKYNSLLHNLCAYLFMIKKIPGTKDILLEEAVLWQNIEAASRKVFSLYNYQEIRFPILEDIALFNRSLGESTEIVQKQMFLIEKGGDTYALRPEGTAGIARAYLENSLDKKYGLMKFYYLGPMFRYERPQKGRMRQFHHLGAEAIGSYAPSMDIEIISLANALLIASGITGYKIKINTLGCPKDKKNLINLLRFTLKPCLSKLCEDCKIRFQQNILRILDCKNETCCKIIQNLKINNEYLCRECRDHFTKLKRGLDSIGIDYKVTPHLVRGLDYYTRTVFEITHESLGAQDALGAGGRYDNLINELGGSQAGAIGFAFGMERLSLATKPQSHPSTALGASKTLSNLVYMITLGEEAKNQGTELLYRLRKTGIKTDTDYEEKSLKGAMRKANDLDARWVLILGENELKGNAIMLKDMSCGTQEKIKLNELIPNLKKRLTLPIGMAKETLTNND